MASNVAVKGSMAAYDVEEEQEDGQIPDRTEALVRVQEAARLLSLLLGQLRLLQLRVLSNLIGLNQIKSD